MQAVILGLVAPITVLVGTGLGLWLGQRRWRTEQEKADRALFESRRREAYLELWDVVEKAHLELRSAGEGLSAHLFMEHLTTVNQFLIRRGLFIEASDQALVLEYLVYTNEFLRRLVASPEERWIAETTMMHSNGYALSARELRALENRAGRTREIIRNRVCSVLGGPDNLHFSWETNPPAMPFEVQVLLSDVSKRATTRHATPQAERPTITGPQ